MQGVYVEHCAVDVSHGWAWCLRGAQPHLMLFVGAVERGSPWLASMPEGAHWIIARNRCSKSLLNKLAGHAGEFTNECCIVWWSKVINKFYDSLWASLPLPLQSLCLWWVGVVVHSVGWSRWLPCPRGSLSVHCPPGDWVAARPQSLLHWLPGIPMGTGLPIDFLNGVGSEVGH